MNSKREARLKYYEGVKEATLQHMQATEESLRKLQGVTPEKIETLVADLKKQHKKLLKRIDRNIKDER